MEMLIEEVAKALGIPSDALEPYGKEIAKVDLDKIPAKVEGKLILVTALTPTKAGEGKTTTAIGLEEGFYKIGEKAVLCLREPALGPVFGLKGGATGALKASLLPEEEINLHFTGDIHAITSANNLISSVLDNSLNFGNPLHIDPSRIVWKRAIDMNDRSLRKIEIGLGKGNGYPREDGFNISVASELMAILCLCSSEEDFLSRLQRIVVAYSTEGNPITVKDLDVSHAVMRLLRHAFKPNLVRNTEGNPVFVHGGPFANIAHGANSLLATKAALRLAPYVITEAGFGSDLGGEKFLDIVCQEGHIVPSAVVLVASIRALKLHGGMPFEELEQENVSALQKGFQNLKIHYENLLKFGVNVVVAINRFPSDTEEEIASLERMLHEMGASFALSEGVLKGGEGAKELAYKVREAANRPNSYHPLYRRKMDIASKIETIVHEIYRAKKVVYSEEASKKLAELQKSDLKDAYICMAKTPMALGDDPKEQHATESELFHIRDFEVAYGASFVIPLSGSILRMPGLPKEPRATKMEEEPWKI